MTGLRLDRLDQLGPFVARAVDERPHPVEAHRALRRRLQQRLRRGPAGKWAGTRGEAGLRDADFPPPKLPAPGRAANVVRVRHAGAAEIRMMSRNMPVGIDNPYWET